MEGKYVAYYRVSTEKQGRSGLGLEAQEKAVQEYLNGGGWKILASFKEVESGKHDDRPELIKALAYCRSTGATLLVAKLDRLSRDAHFLLGLQKASVPFVAADMPQATELTVGIMALVAQEERKAISARTKAALAAAKARGVKLGTDNLTAEGSLKGQQASRKVRSAKSDQFAAVTLPIIEELLTEYPSLNKVAEQLNSRGILTARGNTGSWTAAAVSRIIQRTQKTP